MSRSCVTSAAAPLPQQATRAECVNRSGALVPPMPKPPIHVSGSCIVNTPPYADQTANDDNVSSLESLHALELSTLQTSTVPLNASASLKRSMGKSTPSMRQPTGKRDRLYAPVGKPFWPKAPRWDNKIYSYAEVVQLSTITSNTIANVATSFSFTESQLDKHASLENVFDQYRITRIEFWTQPVTVIGAAAANFGLFTTVVDYDDDATLSSISSALDYENVMESVAINGHYRDFVPAIAIATYSGAFTSFANQRNQWIDCNSNGVKHYGVKTYWTTTDAVYQLACFARFHVQYRNVR